MIEEYQEDQRELTYIKTPEKDDYSHTMKRVFQAIFHYPIFCNFAIISIRYLKFKRIK